MQSFRRGSVLMEMIVVFPIYLVIFGGLFMLGDMLIKVARLPPAERSVAFELGGGYSLRDEIRNRLYHADKEVNDDGLVADQIVDDNDTKPGLSEYYADTSIEGPFSLRAAVKLKDGYYLPGGGTRGQLAFADWFFNTSAGAGQATGDMATLLNGSGRVDLRSKDNSPGRVRYYNYYTLKRLRGGTNWRANSRNASDLLVNIAGHTEHWWNVYKEKYHYDGSEERDQINSATPAAEKGPNAEYTRYGQFETWSD